MKNKAIFLDRDGTLIEDAGYPNDPEQVKLVPDAVEAMQSFINAGFLLVVISNQSGIGRGKIKPEEAEQVHQRFVDLFQQKGITFSGVYYCPHAPEENCGCRKPAPGLILQAAQELTIELEHSFIIGDKLSDVKTGHNAGMKGIMFRDHPSNKGKGIQPEFQSNDWQPIVEWILNRGE
jgi:histidinol-phosphate phosphatase family protein